MINLLLLVPLAGFLACLALKSSAKLIALAASLVVLALSFTLVGGVVDNPTRFSSVTDIRWITTPDIHYQVGVDGLSLWLVILTALLTPVAILAAWNTVSVKPHLFFGFLLLIEFGVIGVFVSLDLFLYYVFWEITLVPVLFLIGMWGTDQPGVSRIQAAVKFFIYTMAGSVVMLAAIIYLYTKTGSLRYEIIQAEMGLVPAAALMPLFLAFFVAFAIKVPLFPLHTWLPDAYTAAPTPVTILLAGLLSKMGTYSLIRFGTALFPQQAQASAAWIAALAIIGILYGALVAISQPNMKRLAAYSSVSHLGFVVLGTFAFNTQGLDGAVYQMINHGVSTGALFLMIAYLEQRRKSLAIADYGGVAKIAPGMALMFMVVTLASVGLPTLGNFVGEFLILQGAAQTSFSWAVFASVGVILSACYMLWLYQRTFFGETSDEIKQQVPDLDSREWAAIVPLVILMIWMGVSANGFLGPITAKSDAILKKPAVKAEVVR